VHSSTSKAAAAAVSVDFVLAIAGWSAESTFRKFYNRPVALTNQMSVAVLQHSISKYGLETPLKFLFYLFVRVYAVLCTVHGQ
jgi:hypothetical protein